MQADNLKGRLSSVQSLGTLDGPGIRYVAFLQGCPLRCGCCHNPETQPVDGGYETTAEELLKDVLRFRGYFGKRGGVTLSGGEPLMQPEFSAAFFELCRKEGIDTCLDTSGCLSGEAQRRILEHTDRVLLDVKYTNDQSYRLYVGCSLDAPLAFLRLLDGMKIPTVLRQVVIPGKNTADGEMKRLAEIAKSVSCVDKIELLPFRKICHTKYEELGREFPFGATQEPDDALIDSLAKELSQYLPDSVTVGRH